jgi:hypothetical protein
MSVEIGVAPLRMNYAHLRQATRTIPKTWPATATIGAGSGMSSAVRTVRPMSMYGPLVAPHDAFAGARRT